MECSRVRTHGQLVFGVMVIKVVACELGSAATTRPATWRRYESLVSVAGRQGHPGQAAGGPVPEESQPSGAGFG
jgi:hypothetical protein